MFFGLIKTKQQKLLFFSLTCLGMSAMITQLVLFREFLTVFYGNELVFGIILGNWLLLTGLGAFFGRYVEKLKEKISLLIYSQITIAALPLICLLAIRFLRNIIFVRGEVLGPIQIIVFSFVLLLPYCLISGVLLTLACEIFSKKSEAESIGKVYFIDNLGDILGGALFSFVLVFFLNHFQMFMLIFILNLIAAATIAKFFNKKFALCLSLMVLLVFCVVIFAFDLNKASTKALFEGQNIVFQKDSLYGNLVVTKSEDQLNFFESGAPLFSTGDVAEIEETIHYAMIQHKNPKNVLLISGGVSGTTKEILKYDVNKIDYVELDPLITDSGKRFTKNLEDPKINVINKDGRLFIKTTKEKYDIVIVDLPDPSNAQINRFYSDEFLKETKKVLNKEGVFSISLSSSPNYISKEAKEIYSTTYSTLKNNFENVIIIPSGKNFFIASDSKLTYNIGEQIEEKGITTNYVNNDYLSGIITGARINFVFSGVKENVGLNKDFKPVAYYYDLLYWLSYFKTNILVFFLILGILLAVYFAFIKAVPFVVFTTGFAASTLEIVILIGFQIIYGYAYYEIGIIITMFMLGLAFGSIHSTKNLKRKGKKDLSRISLAIVIYSLTLPLILMFLGRIKNATLSLLFAHTIFPLLVVILAFLVGALFPIASKLHFKKIARTASTLYTADFIGACIGAIIVSTLLIPLIGLFYVCIGVAALNLLSWFVMKKSKCYV